MRTPKLHEMPTAWEDFSTAVDTTIPGLFAAFDDNGTVLCARRGGAWYTPRDVEAQAAAEAISTDERKYVSVDGLVVEDICAACDENIRQCKCGSDGRSRIKTSCVCPPIPVREFDWVAWIDGEEENGHYGHGRTEQEAIDELNSLLMQFDEENA